jgi:hypothetical protein
MIGSTAAATPNWAKLTPQSTHTHIYISHPPTPSIPRPPLSATKHGACPPCPARPARPYYWHHHQCPGSLFLGIVGQDPSDSKSSRSHADICQFCFHSFEVYSLYSSKMMCNAHEFSNFDRLFLKLNRFICNLPPVLPEPWSSSSSNSQPPPLPLCNLI